MILSGLNASLTAWIPWMNWFSKKLKIVTRCKNTGLVAKKNAKAQQMKVGAGLNAMKTTTKIAPI